MAEWRMSMIHIIIEKIWITNANVLTTEVRQRKVIPVKNEDIALDFVHNIMKWRRELDNLLGVSTSFALKKEDNNIILKMFVLEED